MVCCHSNLIIGAKVIDLVFNSWIKMSKFKGSLDTLLTDDPIGKFSTVDILWQIAFGVNHLHEKNIVHGRLKPSNILVQESSAKKIIFKVSDYGLDKLGVTREVRDFKL